MKHRFLLTLTGIGCKLTDIFHSIHGWIAVACLFVVNFFAG